MDERETGHIRAGYMLRRHYLVDLEEAEKEFDDWLAAHDREVEANALEAVIGQMRLTEARMPGWTHPLTDEPSPPSDEFQRGFREARYKVQHVLGALRFTPSATETDGGKSHG